MSERRDHLLRDYLRKITPSGRLEELMAETAAMPDGVEARPAGAAPHATRAIEKLERGQPLDPVERFELEAIIIPDKRPAIDIVGGDYVVAHPLWTKLNDEPARSTLRATFASIGRVELPGHPFIPYGGTGFVVGDGLLMTNRHVAEIFAQGLGLSGLRFIAGLRAGVDFLRERDGADGTVLRVRRIAMIHPYWDMALLEVEGLGAGRPALTLDIAETGTLEGREVAVVGYPAFDPRNPAEVQNHVFGGVYGVKRLQPGLAGKQTRVESYGNDVPSLAHDSSTLGGNSGSCVIDIGTGNVVGLHFGGRFEVSNYSVPAGELARDGRVIDAGVRFAGTPVRRPTAWDAIWRGVTGEEAGDGTPAAPGTKPATAAASGSQPAAGSQGTGTDGAGGRTFVVPLEITVRLGEAASQATTGTGPADKDRPALERVVEPIRDRDYSNRRGYDPLFLGPEAALPLPRDLAAVVRTGDSHVVPYHHFSIVMHRERRLALFSASNVDASPARRRPGNRPDKDYTRHGLAGMGENDRERWFADPRLPAGAQLPDRFYDRDRKSFDKGHIVRRNDVAWGETYEEMRLANGDTFHATNCAPQTAVHNRSNLGEDNWGDLENLVLEQAETERLCVFAGPVLATDDPIFSGVDDDGDIAVRIPARYWKVIVAARAGRLESFGFVLAHDTSGVDWEFAVPDRWVRHMAPLAEIERLAGIDLAPAVRRGDRFGALDGDAVMARAGIEPLAGGADSGSRRAAPAQPSDVEPVLSAWRERQAGAGGEPAPGEETRFIVNLKEPLSDTSIAAELRMALGLEVIVEPLFEPDRDLDRYRKVEIPRLPRPDRAELFDVARYMRDVLDAETVDPDLGSDYFGADTAPPPDEITESGDLAFWCWVSEKPENLPQDPDWAINKTRTPQAWAFSKAQGRPQAGKGIVVFQPDTGVLPTHPELPKNAHKDPRAANFMEVGKPPVDPMSGGSDGHGTSTGSVVASPVAGRMRGSAPAATLVPIRCIKSVVVFDQSRVAQAVDHARRNGAHVITMSLGGLFSAAMHAAVKKAVADNIIVLAAAGNCVSWVVWPARFDEAIAVGGINEKFVAWKGTSKGSAVDISGPAEFVLRADARDPLDAGKVAGGQGTSYATAHLAGVAACWLAHHGRETLLGMLQGMTMQDLFRAAVRGTATVPPGFDTGKLGAGIVNADSLVRADPLAHAVHETVPGWRGRPIEAQVADLVAEAMGGGGMETVAPALGDPQNLMEIACLALDMARAPLRPARLAGHQEGLEALPRFSVSRGLSRQVGAEGARRLATGAL